MGAWLLNTTDRWEAFCIFAVTQHLYPCSPFRACFLCRNSTSSKAKPLFGSGKISCRAHKQTAGQFPEKEAGSKAGGKHHGRQRVCPYTPQHRRVVCSSLSSQRQRGSFKRQEGQGHAEFVFLVLPAGWYWSLILFLTFTLLTNPVFFGC